MMFRPFVLALVLALPAAVGSAAELEISAVSAPVRMIDPSARQSVAVRFVLSKPARARLMIFDARDRLVRMVEPPDRQGAGEHELRWDGRDSEGRIVPAEAYRFTLEAAAGGQTATWDLSDATGGQAVRVEALEWDPAKKRITYVLPEASRVRIRIGLSNSGPLLRTVRDWVPRVAGRHELVWDGRDVSGLLDLARHPRLALVGEAFALSENTLLVGPEAETVELITSLDGPRRKPKAGPQPKRMLAYAQQRIENRRDFAVKMTVQGRGVSETGAVRIAPSGATMVEIDVSEDMRSRVLGERFEAVYYVNGQFLFENEVGFLPVSWPFDPTGLPPGRHYLSVNLRGYDGHIGVSTIAVDVPDPDSDRPAILEDPVRSGNGER